MSKQLSKPIQNKLEELLSNVGDMSLKRRARRIIEEINPKIGESIVDLGCGTGYYLFLLSNLPVRVKLTGFDNDQKALEEAKIFLEDKNINFVLGDLHKMPFKDKSFDKAVASEVLEHVENDTQVLKEVYRILKPSGVLVISAPSINYPFLWDPINWILQHLFKTHVNNGFWSGIWNNHKRLYELKILKKKFEEIGFKVEEASQLTYWCLPFNHYLVNIVARLLYDVKIPSHIYDKISKFRNIKRPLIFEMIFKFINWVDKLNINYPQKNGVNVFFKARRT